MRATSAAYQHHQLCYPSPATAHHRFSPSSVATASPINPSTFPVASTFPFTAYSTQTLMPPPTSTSLARTPTIAFIHQLNSNPREPAIKWKTPPPSQCKSNPIGNHKLINNPFLPHGSIVLNLISSPLKPGRKEEEKLCGRFPTRAI
ncbi:hypothetical protein SLA2020_113310 [Shorea laevis]